MSGAATIVLILAFLIPLWVLLRTDFIRGLGYAVFVFVSMTTSLRVELPGMLPQLTLHRLFLISLFLYWIKDRVQRRSLYSVPIVKPLTTWAAIYLISLVGAENVPYGFKRCLDLVFERCLFFVIIATSLRTREEAMRVLRSAVYGMTLVAILGVIEWHAGYNLADQYFPVAKDDEDVGMGGAHATYPHRILFGAGCAMGWPLVFALMVDIPQALRKKIRLCLCAGLLLLACYYSMSRGPWLGCFVAFVAMSCLGSRLLKKWLVLVAVVSALLLASRPGVVSTLSGYVEGTFREDAQKNSSYEWRWELWKVAWTEVTQSGWRFLFGYGPAAGHGMELDWSGFRGRSSMVIKSWDNQLAYTVYEVGMVGFIAMLFLYGKLMIIMTRLWARCDLPDRDCLACIIAALFVLLFMMTNVLIFARQLEYLFWTLVSVGFVVGGYYSRNGEEEAPKGLLCEEGKT